MSDLFDLTGKIALVTGASSGMGKAIAHAMGLHGAKMVIVSNDETALAKTAQDFENQGITTLAIVCDVSNKADIDHLFQKIIETHKKIDIFVNCVGIAVASSFLDLDAAQFDKIMHLNLQSAIDLTQRILPQMRLQKDGVLIYLASIASVRGNKSIGLYGISKAGLVQLARNLAVEFGPDNIRANTISPGMIDTPFSKSLIDNELFMTKRLALTPLRRVGTPKEIAGIAVLLASKAGAFMTGQNIIVDGGTTISDGN